MPPHKPKDGKPQMDATSAIDGFFAISFPGRQLNHNDDIFASGFANSMFALQLVNFIEKEFNVEVEDDDLDIENFRTVDRIGALVAKKLARAAA